MIKNTYQLIISFTDKYQLFTDKIWWISTLILSLMNSKNPYNLQVPQNF